MAQKFWVGSGSSTSWAAITPTNWSLTSGGTGDAAVPGATDDVLFDANSGVGSAVIGASIAIKSLDCTGYTGTITHNAFTLTISNGIKLYSGMTYTALTANATCKITFNSTASGNSITTAGKILPTLLFSGAGGGWILQDNITAQTTTINIGTFNANNFNCNLLKVVTGALSTVTMGTGVWTISGITTSVTINSATTLNVNTSTVVLSNTGNNTKTIDFGGKTLYNLTINANAGASHKYYFSTAFTVSNNFTVTGANHIQFLNSDTFTFNGVVTLYGTVGNIITIDSDSAGNSFDWTVDDTATIVNFNYLNITDSHTNAAYFAYSSTDGGNTTGWTITSASANPPAQSSGAFGLPASGSTYLQSSGGKSGGHSSAYVQSTGELQ